jgi:hypothetical protein
MDLYLSLLNKANKFNELFYKLGENDCLDSYCNKNDSLSTNNLIKFTDLEVNETSINLILWDLQTNYQNGFIKKSYDIEPIYKNNSDNSLLSKDQILDRIKYIYSIRIKHLLEKCKNEFINEYLSLNYYDLFKEYNLSLLPNLNFSNIDYIIKS